MLSDTIKKESIKKLYFASLFLVGLPPFFLFHPTFNANTLAKFIWFLIFLALTFGVYKTKRLGEGGKTLLYIFMFFFVSQSLSILTTRNIPAFFQQYEDLAFTALFITMSFYLIEDKKDIKNVIMVLFANAAVNIFFQAAIFVTPNLFQNIAGYVLHTDYLRLISLNIERKRIYFEVFDEALLPLVFVLLLNPNQNKKVPIGIFGLLISTLSFISNFRTRFLMLVASLLGSTVSFAKFFRKKALAATIFVGVFFYIIYSLLGTSLGFTVVDRVLLEDKREDVGSITGRIGLWEKAGEIGMSSPFFGVGLGNYYDNLDFISKHTYSILERTLEEFQFAIFYPHNIFFKVFAETGLVGLFALIFALLYFARNDYEAVFKKERNLVQKAFVVSFWTLFVHALFNPTFTVKYQLMFWLLRLMVEKSRGIKKLTLSRLR